MRAGQGAARGGAGLWLGLGLVAAAYTTIFFHWQLVVDDAYISFRHAANLAAGHGMVFNPGERVEGYSNFLWTLLLAGLARLGAAPPAAALALGYGAGLLTLAGVVWAGRRVLGLERPVALAAAAWLALGTSWSFWAASGMESALFGLALLAAWALAFGPAGARRSGPFWLALVAALAALVRPEGLALAAAAALWLVAFAPGRRRERLAALALLAGALLLHLAWRWSYYGALLPNPYYAKVAASAASLERGVRYLGRYAWQDGALPLLLLAAAGIGRQPARAVLAGALLLYALFIVGVGGDGLYRFRFAAHVAPLLVLCAACGLERLWRRRAAWGALAAAATAGALAWPLASPSFFAGHSLAEVRRSERRWSDVGRALARHADRDVLVATNVIGRLPYHARLVTIDLLGLTDPVIARTPLARPGAGYAGHERSNPGYVLTRAPDLIFVSVLFGLPTQSFRSPRGVGRFLARGPLHGYAGWLATPRFLAAYRPAYLELADGSFANVFVRAARARAVAPPGALRVLDWQDPSARAHPASRPRAVSARALARGRAPCGRGGGPGTPGRRNPERLCSPRAVSSVGRAPGF